MYEVEETQERNYIAADGALGTQQEASMQPI